MKEDVDDYRQGRGIPSCELLVRIVDQSTTQPLEHTITLNGAKPANTYFTLFIANPGHGMQRYKNLMIHHHNYYYTCTCR
jgi:hypothetical protein